MPFRGTTVRLTAIYKDYDGSLLTPDTKEVRIYDPDGNEIDGSPFDPNWWVEESKFYYAHSIAADATEGSWKAVWTFTKGGESNVDRFFFVVEKP